MAKIYNDILRNCIEPKIEKILKKNQNSFRRNQSSTSQILIICRILEDVCAKIPLGHTIICQLFQGIWLHTQRDVGANTSRLRPPQRNFSATIMILYKNTKVCNPDGDTNYFDIVAGVLQGDTLAPYLFSICLGLRALYFYRFNERKQF